MARHFATLDGLRGMLAVAVMAGHLIEAENLVVPLHRYYLAVDFFFLLSGFVVARAYEVRLRASDHRIGYFCRTRLIRLYPMIFFGTLLGALASLGQALLAGSVGLEQVATATVMGLLVLPLSPFTDGSGGVGFPLNGAVWSLFYELAVNFAWVVVLPFASRRNVLLVVALGVVWILAVAAMNGSLHYGADFRRAFEGSGRVVFSFSAGLALAHLGVRAPKLSPLAILLATTALLAVPAFPGDRFYDAVCVILLFPLLLWLAAANEPDRLARVFLWSGALSYPLYLLHIPILRVGHHVFSVLEIDGHLLWLCILLEGIVIVVTSHIVLKLYDEPIRSWLRQAGHRQSSKSRSQGWSAPRLLDRLRRRF